MDKTIRLMDKIIEVLGWIGIILLIAGCGILWKKFIMWVIETHDWALYGAMLGAHGTLILMAVACYKHKDKL